MKVFWFHYNKPASSAKGKPQITVHYNKKCYIVDNIVCEVPIRGHLRESQPRFVVKGRCENLNIIDNVCYVK